MTVQRTHDRTVDTPERYRYSETARAGLEHAQATLGDEQREWLANLPSQTEFADGEFRLVHSHPDHGKQGRYVRPPQFPKMRSYLVTHAGLVPGHTHVQYCQKLDDRLIVNPGSVGQPRDGDPKTAYAVLGTDQQTATLRGVAYDIDRVVTAVEEAGLPSWTGSRLRDET